MSITSWRKVGKVKDAHGLRGELWILIFSKDVSWSKGLKQFALGPDNPETTPTICEIESIKPFKEGLRLKAVGMQDRTQAEAVKGLMFYVPEELFESEEGDVIYLSEILNFEIWDKNVCQGVITSFSSNQAQDLLVVSKTTGGTAEIPFVEHFIVEIDFENKKVLMDLPEGLWDLSSL